jgi:hypothetical protein
MPMTKAWRLRSGNRVAVVQVDVDAPEAGAALLRASGYPEFGPRSVATAEEATLPEGASVIYFERY